MTEKLASISQSIVIDRPIASVWTALTLRASDWLGCMRYEAKIGHVFYMQPDREKAGRDDVAGATHCEILALDAPKLFKFSWYMPGTAATEVSFQLSALDEERTRVDFIHEGWEKFPVDQIKPVREMLDGGWRSYVLPGLKRVAESQR